MTLPPSFDGLSEVRAAVTADLKGRVLAGTPGARLPAETVATAASVVADLAAAGSVVGLAGLELLVVKGPGAAMVAAIRPDALLLVAVDPFRATKAVEAVASAWVRPGDPTAPAAPPRSAERAAAPPAPTVAPAPSGQAREVVERRPDRAAPAGATDRGGQGPDAWAALRRALVRGHLTEAVARQRDLLAPAAAGARRPGSEPLPAAECAHALELLLEGVGSVMAGDGVGGDRILRELAAPSQQNLSFRWLALHWSARAALKRGSFPTARAHVKESLELGRQLDIEARAVSQWVAAEVLAHDRDPARALAWLAEARGRFERIADTWGLAQTWLAEARILALLQREDEAAEAARQAAARDPAWDEPPIFLARRALLRDDLAAAEALLGPLRTPAADRVRALIEAIRQGKVGRADAAEFLHEHDAPPSARSIRALARIAGTSPGFLQAREALAWMLLKIGKYDDAAGMFRALLSQELSPGDRASVMLGLGCIANARETGGEPPSPRAVVAGPAATEVPPAQRPSSSSILARAQQAATGGTESVFSGRLSVFALPDLLEFLRTARRTGLLVCSTAAGMGALRFREGFITGAASPATPGVADLLVRAGKLGSQALRAVPAGAEQTDQVVGARLVRDGLVDAGAVQEALERQIALVVRELVSWKDGEFAFSRELEGEAAPGELPVSVDPQAVLLDVFRQMDEASRGPAEAGAKP
ncbi:DUF4388 domain-containing protein [Anaeromyxobacter oryzae]|uniref:PatA-like N-terminal domain-containing protein n=1 Tax=Anaeromyxobacter oryzae TaxID=2918170 RepID=A0ABN6MUP8_9BACT|nr:DUF4388 domain-containing protein [Anaeromyxobacter oryzae]BDG04655.1 hypothetical protein AMOR_36510 [Anaeromyxobacter oryzae]